MKAITLWQPWASLIVDGRKPIETRPRPDPYGDYTPGRWGYFLENVVKFSEPIPARGKQGFWDWQHD